MVAIKKEYYTQKIKGNGSANKPAPDSAQGWRFLSEKTNPRLGITTRVQTREKKITTQADVDELADLFGGISGVGSVQSQAAAILPTAAPAAVSAAVVQPEQAAAMDQQLQAADADQLDELLGMLSKINLKGGRRRSQRKTRKATRKNRKVSRRHRATAARR